MIRLLTRHDKDFNILTDYVDPNLSGHAEDPAYVPKVESLYRKLNVRSGLWAVPESRPMVSSIKKEYEYLFEIEANRIIAYVDTDSWDHHINSNGPDNYEYWMTPPADGQKYTLLVNVPLAKKDIIELRIWGRIAPGVSKYKIVERVPGPDLNI